MRRILALVALLVLLPGLAVGQDGSYIRYYPPQLTSVGGGGFSLTGPLVIPATQAGRGPAIFDMGITTNPIVVLGYNFNADYSPYLTNEPAAGFVIEGNYDDATANDKMEAYVQFTHGNDSTKYTRSFMTMWDRTTKLPVATSISGGTSGVGIYNNVGGGAAGSEEFVSGNAVANFGATANTSYVPWIIPAGSQSAPSIGFTGQPNTGFYYNSSNIYFSVLGAGRAALTTIGFYPVAADSFDMGAETIPLRSVYASHQMSGGKNKALTAGAATTFVVVAIPSTALVNYANGKVIWSVRASDATDIQTLSGESAFNCVNKADTETCAAIVTYSATAVAASAGAAADDLACTMTAVTGLANSIGLAMNCATVEMTETSLSIRYRLDMPQQNTVTPQ